MKLLSNLLKLNWSFILNRKRIRGKRSVIYGFHLGDDRLPVLYRKFVFKLEIDIPQIMKMIGREESDE